MTTLFENRIDKIHRSDEIQDVEKFFVLNYCSQKEPSSLSTLKPSTSSFCFSVSMNFV